MKYRLFQLVVLECLNRQSQTTLRQIKCTKMICNYAILLACAFMIKGKNLPDNNTAIISTYAKVAHWGSVSTTTGEPQSEGRSHSGQTLWTHRSEANIVGGQNLKAAKPKVVYQYPIHKVGQGNIEVDQGVGEVQERFNPRPYFDYTHLPPKSQSAKSDTKPKGKPDATPATFDSFPVFNSPPASPTDLYAPPQYSSYIPPSSGPVGPPDNSKPDASYPPSISDDDNGAPDDSASGYSYDPPQDKPPAPKGPPSPSKPTLGPPLAPQDQKDQLYYPPADDQDDKEQLYYPPSTNQNQKPQLYYPPSSSNGHKPAYYPHGHKEQLYYPPSDNGSPHETILDHPPPGWQDSKGMSDMGGPPDMAGPPDMGGPSDMKGVKGGHDMAEDDLSPPPSADFGGQFPQYLYNGHGQGHDQGHDLDYDFDHHHVYKEITTTTEAPEDERVNKGHYSYYYLGRKLWYIPLYFSVYFILYVTVLILKSIARHKIQFKHQYLKKDMAKDMSKDMEHGRSFDIDELHDNVTTAIDTSRRKFTYVAM